VPTASSSSEDWRLGVISPFEMGKRAYPPLELDGGAWEYEDEWRLFEDLAVLEEWSGATLPMPDEVTAEEATRAAQAASWARTEQVDAVLAGAISFTTREVLHEKPDELRLFQQFVARFLGVEVPLGEGAAAVRLRRVDREDNDGSRYRAHPDLTDVPFVLSAPAERRLPPRRTQRERVSPPQEQGEDERLRASL
jgi:hypothetical protein